MKSARKSSASHRAIYISFAAVTIFAGLVLRRVHLGLPFIATKYGGSALWAVMLYWTFAALRPSWKPAETGFVSAIFAAMVELFKLYHTPVLDAFRRTVAGTLLLGRFFSAWDIAIYWSAIAVTAWIDRRVIRRS